MLQNQEILLPTIVTIQIVFDPKLHWLASHLKYKQIRKFWCNYCRSVGPILTIHWWS